jgi:hypothetical protein
MRHIILFLAFAGVISVFGAAAYAQQQPPAAWSMTVEAEGGALLVSGPRESIEALRGELPASASPALALDAAADFIIKKHPDLQISIFRASELPVGSEARQMLMPLRRAEVQGVIPIVEGLGANDMKTVMAASGISAFMRDEWMAMGPRDRTQAMLSGDREIVVFSGAAPMDDVRIILLGKNDSAGGGDK